MNNKNRQPPLHDALSWQKQQQRAFSEDEDWAVRQIPPSASHHYQTPSVSSGRGRMGGLVLDANAVNNIPSRKHGKRPKSSTSSTATYSSRQLERHFFPSSSAASEVGTSSTSVIPNLSRLFQKKMQDEVPQPQHRQDARNRKPIPKQQLTVDTRQLSSSSLSFSSPARTEPKQNHVVTRVTGRERQSGLDSSLQHQHTAASTPTAAQFAQDAPMAGFLHKFGNRVPEFKRRFFVLQPATHLYYFLSPNDSQPRGCLDLSESWIEPITNGNDNARIVERHGTVDDETNGNPTEFAVCWHEGRGSSDSNVSNNQNSIRRVVLQAKTAEQANSWMDMMKSQRLDVVQTKLDKERRQTAGYRARLRELETQLEHYKLMEQDRDMALQDADLAHTQLQQLDQGVLQLALSVQRRIRNNQSNHNSDLPESQTYRDEKLSSIGDDKGETEPSSHEKMAQQGEGGQTVQEQHDGDGTHLDETQQSTPKHQNGQSIAGDHFPNEQDDVENEETGERRQTTIEEAQSDGALTTEDLGKIPGSHFSTLFHAFLQLEDQWKLAVEESSAAVRDLTTAQSLAQKMQKRMDKAEKHLLKLWEENCEIRQQLKQRKREKRVLVQEVKNLQQQLEARNSQKQQQMMSVQSPSQRDNKEQVYYAPSAETAFVDDDGEEEKLINELEEHVSTSILLHEQMLRVNSPSKRMAQPSPMAGEGVDHSDVDEIMPTEPAQSKTARSLFDEEDSGDEDERGSTEDENEIRQHLSSETVPENDQEGNAMTGHSVISDENENDISSIKAELGDDETREENGETEDYEQESNVELNGNTIETGPSALTMLSPLSQSYPRSESPEGSPNHPNPLLDLDVDTPSPESPSMTVRPSTRLVTNSGQATSALACPLADVVGADRSDVNSLNTELQVYHLTFYSRKIGIQFQRVPPPPAKAQGLLTEAMTADLAGVPVAGEKTAAELRRIATLSTWAKSDGSHGQKNGEALEPVTPVDAVLVCGFQGFDDSGNNERPKIGARLVAFDGVSVEVGRWTFDSIRKAIQTRGRPLTLSFRDDFLTTEQRKVLTKAVTESEPSSFPPPRPEIQQAHREIMRQTSMSTASLGSYDGDHFMGEDGSVRSLQSARSVRWNEEDSSLKSPLPRRHNQFRSFSEAGSSTTSSVLSAVGPLMSNLLYNKSSSNTPFTPEYLKRPQVSVEDTPQHQDFRASLL